MAFTSFDKYSLNARLYPALILFLPIGLSVASFFPEKFTGCDLLVATITTCGLSFFLENLARDQGKKKESELFELWGGKPTTLMLRYKDTALEPVTLERYHKKLESLLSIKLPSPQEELEVLSKADELYESCVKYLRENTRDWKEYRLIFAENVNYGFRRNLWGIKPAAIVIILLSLLVVCISLYLDLIGLKMVVIATVLLNIGLLVLWTIRINPEWVKVPAFDYARHLLSACDRI